MQHSPRFTALVPMGTVLGMVLLGTLPLLAQRTQIPAFAIDYSGLTGPLVEVPLDLKMVVLPNGEPFSVEAKGSIPAYAVKALATTRWPESDSASCIAFTLDIKVPQQTFTIHSTTQESRPEFIDRDRIKKWDEKDARKLDEKIVDGPDSVADRMRMLEYAATHPSPYARELRTRHLPWLIRNAPDSEGLATPSMLVSRGDGPLADPALHAQVASLWLEAVARTPAKPEVLRSAAWFLSTSDPEVAYEFLSRQRRNLGIVSVWIGDTYAIAALGITDRSEENGEASMAGAELPDSDFARAARSRLKETDDLPMLLAAANRLTKVGRELAKAGHVPAGYDDFCASVVANLKSMQPSYNQICDSTAPEDIPPKPKKKPEPKYPPDARERRQEGEVTLSLTIDTEGKPANIGLIEGPFVFWEEARKAIEKWRFTPRMRDGKPVESTATIEVKFRLI